MMVSSASVTWPSAVRVVGPEVPTGPTGRLIVCTIAGMSLPRGRAQRGIVAVGEGQEAGLAEREPVPRVDVEVLGDGRGAVGSEEQLVVVRDIVAEPRSADAVQEDDQQRPGPAGLRRRRRKRVSVPTGRRSWPREPPASPAGAVGAVASSPPDRGSAVAVHPRGEGSHRGIPPSSSLHRTVTARDVRRASLTALFVSYTGGRGPAAPAGPLPRRSRIRHRGVRSMPAGTRISGRGAGKPLTTPLSGFRARHGHLSSQLHLGEHLPLVPGGAAELTVRPDLIGDRVAVALLRLVAKMRPRGEDVAVDGGRSVVTLELVVVDPT